MVSLIRVHWSAIYPVDSAIGRYTAFEQLGPGNIVIFLSFTPKGKYGFKDFFFVAKSLKVNAFLEE